MRRRGLVAGAALVALAGCGDGGQAGEATAPLVTVGEPQITPLPSGHRVTGRVKNQAKRPYSGTVEVTLFDEAGKIVSSYYGAVDDVAPGDEATYTAVGPAAPASWVRVEAKVQTATPR